MPCFLFSFDMDGEIISVVVERETVVPRKMYGASLLILATCLCA